MILTLPRRDAVDEWLDQNTVPGTDSMRRHRWSAAV